MYDLFSFVPPLKLKKGTDFIVSVPPSNKTNTVLFINGNPVETINNSCFKGLNFRYFFMLPYRRDYTTELMPRLERPEYKTVLNATSILKCPMNAGLLNLINTYFDFSREFSCIQNSDKAKVRRKKVAYLGNMLADQWKVFNNLGYTNKIIYIPLKQEDISNPDSFLNLVLFAFKFGWGLDVADVEYTLVLEANNHTILRLPVKIMDKPMVQNIRQRIFSLVSTIAKQISPKLALTDELSKNEQIQVSSLDNSNQNLAPINDSDISISNSPLYVCTQNVEGDLALGSKNAPIQVYRNTYDAVIDTFAQNISILEASSFDNLTKIGLLAQNGFVLAKILNNKDVTIQGTTGYLEKETKIDVSLTKPKKYEMDNTPVEAADYFIPIELATNIFIKYASTDINAKILKKMNTLSKEEMEVHDEIIGSITTFITNYMSKLGSTFDPENFKPFLTEIREYVKSREIVSQIEKLDGLRIASTKKLREIELTKSFEEKAKQANVIIQGQELGSIQDVLKKFEDEDLSKPVNIKTNFDYMTKNISDNINVNYASKYMVPDLLKIVSGFNNEFSDPPVFIDKVEIVDSSDEFNLTNSLQFSYNIPGRKPQSIKLDFPKLTKDGYLFTNGTKKFINNQVITLPIIYINSIGKHSVQFTTNYNKTFIEKMGQRLNKRLSKFIKTVIEYYGTNTKFKANTSIGKMDGYIEENGILTTLPVKEMASHIVKIKLKDWVLTFDPREYTQILIEQGYDKGLNYPGYDLKLVPMGFRTQDKKYVEMMLCSQTGEIFTVMLNDAKSRPVKLDGDIDFTDVLLDLVEKAGYSDFRKLFDTMSTGKKFMHSSIKAIGRNIPLVAFIGWRIGLSKILSEYNVDFEFSQKREPSNARLNETIKFANMYLHYKYSIRNGLLLNGLYELNCEEFDVLDFEQRGNAYKSWFVDISSSNLGKAIDNFYSVFIDPITKELLEDLQIPSDLAGACLYCNTMLESTVAQRKNDMSNYRIRGMEAITAIIYKTIGDAVNRYRNAAGSIGAGIPLSVKSDTVMKELNSNPIIEELKLMNPAKEALNRIKTTYKGPAGTNFKSAKGTEEIREYSKSMVGVLSPTTPIAETAGISRYLSINPSIVGKRGIIKVQESTGNLNASNVLNITELLTPFSATNADPQRFGMVVGQMGHQIPTKVMHPPLIGCNAEKAIKYAIGDEFVFKAKGDGVVKKIDEKNELIIIEYKDGTQAPIDLSTKNGRVSDGYFISIRLQHELKVGDKFKENDILAMDKQYFTGLGNEASLMVGMLANVAVASTDITYEDSSIISQRLMLGMESDVTFDKKIALSPSSNISNVKVKGDKIKAGESLLIYEEIFGVEDDSVSKLLTKIGDKFQENINEYAKSTVPSKYSGEIVEMRIYYNREIEEYSDSIQELIRRYQRKNKEKVALLENTDRTQVVHIPTVEKVNTDRVAGQEFDGLMIHYFIKTTNVFVPGNKLAVGVALKSIVGSIYDEGKNPVSESGEEIDLCLSPFSTASRMVPDAFKQGYINKCLIKMKSNVLDIFAD